MIPYLWNKIFCFQTEKIYNKDVIMSRSVRTHMNNNVLHIRGDDTINDEF